MSRAQRSRGSELALALISEEPERAEMARKALRDAPPKVTDAAAEALCEHLKNSGRSKATARALSHKQAPRFGIESHTRLMMALTEAGHNDAVLKWMQHGDDPNYLEKAEDAKPPLGTNLLRRIASVATRAWVIVVFGLPALFGGVWMFTEPTRAPVIAGGLAALGFVCVVLDAFMRRCPSCGKLLAGQLLSIVRDGSYTTTDAVETTSGTTAYVESTVHTHKHNWRCVFCQHKWSS